MNDITELRGILFDALRGLNDKEKPLDLDRARATADIAQTIINSAKVEVEFIKAAGGKGSGFIPLSGTHAPGAGRTPFQNAIGNVTGGNDK
ncbi:MAG: hypothetical protein WCY72_10925 [Lysobacteraceae bacterium]